jgi:hypothetical protein
MTWPYKIRGRKKIGNRFTTERVGGRHLTTFWSRFGEFRQVYNPLPRLPTRVARFGRSTSTPIANAPDGLIRRYYTGPLKVHRLNLSSILGAWIRYLAHIGATLLRPSFAKKSCEAASPQRAP